MDRLEAMSILLHTVEHGSLTKAAKALHMKLPTISRKVSELEAHLGTRLLQRSTRRLALTEAGATYIAAARRILDEVAEAERTASGEYTAPRGELVLTAPLLFGQLHLLPVVTDFLATYPAINIRLLLSDRNLHLPDEQIDVAVRIGTLPDSAMVATRVGSMPRVACAAPALLATHGTPQRLEALSALPCIGLDARGLGSFWSFREPKTGRALDHPITPRLSVTTADAAVRAAVRGTGVINLLRYQCADALRAGTLVPILQAFMPEPAPIHLVHPSRGLLPLKLRTFLDFAADRLRATLREFS